MIIRLPSTYANRIGLVVADVADRLQTTGTCNSLERFHPEFGGNGTELIVAFDFAVDC